MNAKEWAAQLNNRSAEDVYSLRKELGADRMLVLCTESDDLIESNGFYHEEFGAYNGTTVYVDQDGMHQYRRQNSIPVLVENQPKDDDCFFRITPLGDVPYESFDVIEDDEVYCRAVIFHQDDLPKPRTNYTSSELAFAHQVIVSTLAYLKEEENLDVDEILTNLSESPNDLFVETVLKR